MFSMEIVKEKTRPERHLAWNQEGIVIDGLDESLAFD